MKDYNQPTSIKIPIKPEYIGVARLVIAAYAGFLGFDSETTEDIKIAVSEACTNAILQLHKESYPESSMVKVTSYAKDGRLVIEVKYPTKEVVSIEKTPSQAHERDLGMSILTSIMDKVETTRAKDHSVIIRLVKKIPK